MQSNITTRDKAPASSDFDERRSAPSDRHLHPFQYTLLSVGGLFHFDLNYLFLLLVIVQQCGSVLAKFVHTFCVSLCIYICV